jgi:hypothetical protein
VSDKETSPLPPEVISHWPEVFKDVDVQVVPLEYLHSIRVFFVDGKIWDIDMAKTRDLKQNQDSDTLEKTLEDLFEQYEDVITNIDFRLNTKKLKQDITNRTKLFLKKRK